MVVTQKVKIEDAKLERDITGTKYKLIVEFNGNKYSADLYIIPGTDYTLIKDKNGFKLIEQDKLTKETISTKEIKVGMENGKYVLYIGDKRAPLTYEGKATSKSTQQQEDILGSNVDLGDVENLVPNLTEVPEISEPSIDLNVEIPGLNQQTQQPKTTTNNKKMQKPQSQRPQEQQKQPTRGKRKDQEEIPRGEVDMGSVQLQRATLYKYGDINGTPVYAVGFGDEKNKIKEYERVIKEIMKEYPNTTVIVLPNGPMGVEIKANQEGNILVIDLSSIPPSYELIRISPNTKVVL